MVRCPGVLLFFFVFWCCVCVYVFVPFALSVRFVFFVVGVLGGVWFVGGLFWGGFCLFLGLFFGIMVLGGFLGI